MSQLLGGDLVAALKHLEGLGNHVRMGGLHVLDLPAREHVRFDVRVRVADRDDEVAVGAVASHSMPTFPSR